MMRLFNQKLGFGRKDDVAPKKAYIAIEYGEGDVAQLTPEEFENALDAYYGFAGWDITTGNPTPETIKRLGLEWVVA